MTPSSLVLKLEDMYTLEKFSSSISGYSYDSSESILEFTASISSPYVGAQYRATITNGGSEIWAGSISVFTSQSIDKPNYINQIPLEDVFVSNVTENEYIILQ
jgi:hypothetical protein